MARAAVRAALQEVRDEVMGARRFTATIPRDVRSALAAFDACIASLDAKLAALEDATPRET